MMFEKTKKVNQRGFTLVETLTYLFIASMLLIILSSLVMNIFQLKRQMQSSYLVNNNARFIVNFLLNRVHNVDIIEDVSPLPETFYFYQMPSVRFSLNLEDGNLIYREVYNTGSGFPDQSTAEALQINADEIVVSNFELTTVADAHGNTPKGINISFTLTAGNSDYPYGYVSKPFNTFISIR